MKTPEERAALVAQMIVDMPYSQALQLYVERFAPGEMDIVLPYSTAIVGDPDTGIVHGGAVSALMDTTCGAAVMAHPKASLITATLDLRIDYMRPAKAGDPIVAKAECYHVTRSVAFVRAAAFDSDLERPVAAATGAFTVTGGFAAEVPA